MKEGRIEKISIPDSDAHNWITDLQKWGFSQEQIDIMMTSGNATYAQHRFQKYYDKVMAIHRTEYLAKHGREMTPAEEETMRRRTLEEIQKRQGEIAKLEKALDILDLGNIPDNK